MDSHNNNNLDFGAPNLELDSGVVSDNDSHNLINVFDSVFDVDVDSLCVPEMSDDFLSDLEEMMPGQGMATPHQQVPSVPSLQSGMSLEPGGF